METEHYLSDLKEKRKRKKKKTKLEMGSNKSSLNAKRGVLRFGYGQGCSGIRVSHVNLAPVSFLSYFLYSNSF
jgi:hypothetical protein